jgi:hypothetical protein
MAIGVYFSPAAMSVDQYNECIRLLRKTGAGHPPGRSYHACFGAADRIMVFDVWTSQAAFDKFGKVLMPILHQVGVDPGVPGVMPVHKVIVPPIAASRPKARRARAKAKPARRKAGKKR